MKSTIQKCCATAPYISRRSLHQTSLLRSSSNPDSYNEPPPSSTPKDATKDDYSEDFNFDLDPSTDFFDSSRPYQIDSTSKSVLTKTGLTLPLSPIMDPAYHSSRNRWKEKKPLSRPPGQRVSKFSQLLESSPFALALAAPLRACTATEVLLPKPFLQKFNLLRHPETDEPWFVPADLAPHGAPDPAKKRDQELGPSAYTLANQALLQDFVIRGSPYYGSNRKMLRRNAQNRTGLTDVLNRAVWREDMDSLVLKLMRRRIVDELLYLTGKCTGSLRRKYLTPLRGGYEEAKERKLRGALVYVGGAPGKGMGMGMGTMRPPQRVSTLDIKGERYNTRLPVYDATVLLGEEELKRLVDEETGFWRQAQLFAVGREATTELQIKLWKLEGYMAKGKLLSPEDRERELARAAADATEAKVAEMKAAQAKAEKRHVPGGQGQRDAQRAPARDTRGPGGGDRRPGGWQGVRRT
ncbi:hypothetical protein SMACR_02746 [Sordaria macrospora]|uniref:WGS project CABT00000000 data, contig 2.11 n=2 Tax=Sordaria macrospora TaxID=5147 RepID=F7VXC7_SORMK|nr:uncharacterized protein SMAC_02746 [Sordaria macrospora k-hell]KAA8636315.1 hypothetical protein SMACR_02746 [Sordaria macrospora]KAH7633136.1 hypothetical protein B0T09DRAFT_332919 [Sordaria sp. MPI-SDFR-AT-0083]WPJ60421.1 hypothetical protein SMAC4_02746 [Sordaria macrospora]CCC10169.1 unnamed protein product [Sordaria macrospora k-hell]